MMNILVFQGSPKGEKSVTWQYLEFIKKKFPQHKIEIIPIAHQIKKIEQDKSTFEEILESVKKADGIIWAFPLYFFLVAAQYKRFIELIEKRKVQSVFANKYATALTTSIHFYDHTAHNYIHAVSEDWGMNYFPGFSAEMRDLLKEEERAKLHIFVEHFFTTVEKKAILPKVFVPLVKTSHIYQPDSEVGKISLKGKKLVVVTDNTSSDSNLQKMVGRFTSYFNEALEVVSLNDIEIKGGCLGCLQCAYDNTCVYQGKDGFIDFYNSKVKTADIVVFAGTIKDRYLSSLWKTYFDRSFFNTHIPSLKGKQVLFLIEGPLRQLANLRQILEAYIETQQANLVGIVTDEDDSSTTDQILKEKAVHCVQYALQGYIHSLTYLSIGARKLFRDEVWGNIRFPFIADHKYYQENGIYDFPQKNYPARIINFLLGLLIKIPSIRFQIYGRMKEEMIKPLKKVLDTI